MLLNWEFYVRTKIMFGKNKISNINYELTELNAKKPLIVTDAGVEKAGIASKVINILQTADFEYEIFNKVESNPSTEIVEMGLELFQKEKCDSVVAIGGGSSMDTGKAIAIMINNKGNISDYDHFLVLNGHPDFENSAVPIIAIPTTVGTGSEVTCASVVTDKLNKKKMAIISRKLLPNVAIVDPSLVINLPREIIASTGADALTHAIEGYLCRNASPVTDALNLTAIKIMFKNLREAVNFAKNSEAVGNMLLGSMMTGMGFTNCGLGNVHAMSAAVGGILNTPHGVTNAVILPHVMLLNQSAQLNKFVEIAKVMNQKIDNLDIKEAGKKAISGTIQLLDDIGISDSLKDLGVSEGMINELASKTMEDGDYQNDPRITSLEEIKQLFKNTLLGRAYLLKNNIFREN